MPDLPVHTLDHIVGTDLHPVFRRKVTVSQCFLNPSFHFLGCLRQFHRLQFRNNSCGLLSGCLLAFLIMDRLEHLSHILHLGFGHNSENIPVEVNHTALVFGFRKYLSCGFQHTQTFVTHNEFYAAQAPATKLLDEADPACLLLFHALGSAQNFTITILIDGNCHQNSHVFILSAPISYEIDAVHIHLRVLASLQRMVPPGFDVNVGLLVQLTDGGCRHLAAP